MAAADSCFQTHTCLSLAGVSEETVCELRGAVLTLEDFEPEGPDTGVRTNTANTVNQEAASALLVPGLQLLCCLVSLNYV